MPRGQKCRRVCGEPVCRRFLPEGGTGEPIRLRVEELESLRLCDAEGLEQGEAAQRMDVSRGTFQRILYAARRKTAQALVSGAELIIEGGQYEVRGEGCRYDGEGQPGREPCPRGRKTAAGCDPHRACRLCRVRQATAVNSTERSKEK